MASHLFSSKSLPEPMLTYHQLDPLVKFCSEIWNKIQEFFFRKTTHMEVWSPNVSHSVLSLMCRCNDKDASIHEEVYCTGTCLKYRHTKRKSHIIISLEQDCGISTASALEIPQSCTKPSICRVSYVMHGKQYTKQKGGIAEMLSHHFI